MFGSCADSRALAFAASVSYFLAFWHDWAPKKAA
jgi:hypothetical protein